MKLSKNLTAAVFGVSVAALAGASHAANVSVDGVGATLPTSRSAAEAADFYFVFESRDPVVLSRTILGFTINVSCNDLLLGGYVYQDGSDVVVEVSDAEIGDTSGLCSDVDLQFSNSGGLSGRGDWYAVLPVTDLQTSENATTPLVLGQFENVQVLAPGLFSPSYCATTYDGSGGALDVSYSNNGTNDSVFSFDSALGNCALRGAFFSSSDPLQVGSGPVNLGSVKVWQ